MYSRDPFNLRRANPAAHLLRSTSVLRESAAQATHRAFSAAETLLDKGKQVFEASDRNPHEFKMTSYALPNGGALPNSAEIRQTTGRLRPHHDPDSESTLGEKVSSMFHAERNHSLPMYKDKPYHYADRRKRQPWYRQRRVIVSALVSFAILSWWTGVLSPLSWVSSRHKSIGTKPKDTGWSLFGGGKETADWSGRAERVKDAFKISFADYEAHGWGYDEYHPKSKTGKYMVPDGMGWIIVDALDTLMLMNLSTELTHARQWIHDTLTYDKDHDVNTFETTIRMLGGLLSAHYLSTSFPGVYAPVQDDLSDDLYVEKAADLADRLLGAYETSSGVPLASINLHTMQGIPSHADGGASSTAEATSLQLEMKYLAKLTGETHYWEHAENVMKVVDGNHMPDGLLPIFIHADRGIFRGSNIRLGSRGDSYYEYLIKQYLQTSEQEPVYQAMWNESLGGIKKHLITYSQPNNWTILAEKPNGLQNGLSPKMDHLVCFMPGTIALATTRGLPLAQARKQPQWGEKEEDDMRLAEELMRTCMGMYKVTPTGLAAEITYFNVHSPPLMYNDFAPKQRPRSPAEFFECVDAACTEKESTGKADFIVHATDVHNLQRPETVESLFYMWRITGEESYRQWGWDMFQSFVNWTAVDDGSGFSSVSNVMVQPPGLRDNMESFWLAETLKYFYLLFSSDDILPLTDVVFNTEAHPFPRFGMGKLFKTGWQRGGAADASSPEAKDDQVNIQTISVTPVVATDAAAATPTEAGMPLATDGVPLSETDQSPL